MSRRPDRRLRMPKRRASHSSAANPATEASTVESLMRDGVQHLTSGALRRAHDCFDRVCQFMPQHAVAWNCLGIVARAEGRVNDAIALFERALGVRADFPEARNNLGNAWRDAGNLVAAQACYEQAIALQPALADAHNNLGVILLSQHQAQRAIPHFEAAIRLRPDYVEAWNNWANALQRQGDLTGALRCLQHALHMRPASPELHNNVANVLRESGQAAAAQAHLEQAIRLNGRFAPAFENLGSLLIDREQADEAVAVWSQAAALRPSDADPLIGLGHAHRLCGDFEAAQRIYHRAQSLQPGRRSLRLLTASLCPPVFRSRQEILTWRNRALQEWSALAHDGEDCGRWSLAEALTEPSFSWQFLDGDLRPLKEAYAAIFRDGFEFREVTHCRPGRPRLGVVVTSGHEGLFLRSMRGVLERLPDHNYELVLVCPRASVPQLREALPPSIPFLAIPARLDEAADTIRDAGFRALYYWEIGTDAMNYFLPHLRLAPVQCTSWGIQVTSGIPTVDYYLSSALVEPPEAADHYSERLLLAATLLTYQARPAVEPSSRERESWGCSADQHLYVCAQQPGKFHPDFDKWLATLLRRDPRGVLIITGDRYGLAMQRLRARMAETMADVCDRCVCLPRLSYPDYLRLLAIAHVVLDPPHFGGVNSSYDAFAVGQPVVACPSSFHRGRYTAACYERMGWREPLAATPDQYIDLACALAEDPHRRHAWQSRVREASPELFEDVGAVHEHDRLFRELVA
ncbi:MAG: tetratricopeptide repeat protein [Pirellulaceae bacterium]